ncbi:hypothetical protein [Luteolibacter sp. Populi]|uniref:hypothetical protein n=1 Tax=Luteolibacter sp. Populi TaxID=3230487 RepID=UPI003466FE7B
MLPRLRKNGFALVITLSLMVLLTILAVGLLTMSSLSLSTAGRELDRAEARANARMALSMAIAQLQKTTGPDQRITMTADQLPSSNDGGDSAATDGRKHWTGVYNGWTTTSTSRPAPSFRSWLVSGEHRQLDREDMAKESGGGDDSVQLVGTGTLGGITADGLVEVPAVRVKANVGTSTDASPRIAWWTGDQGVKAALATPPPSTGTGAGDIRAGLQTAPRNAVEFAKSGQAAPFENLKHDDPDVTKVTDWQQSGFLATDPNSPKALFHDLASSSTGLLTNVRTGGFRKDLSMQLERSPAQANSTLVSSKTALYKVAGENGINLHELWAYYNIYKPTEMKSSGSAKYTTGGNIPSGTRYLMVAGDPGQCQSDDEFYFKQPTVISYQIALSLGVKTMPVVIPPSTVAVPTKVISVIADPIITLWNPLDLPVVVPTGSFMSVKYWSIPFSLYLSMNGGPAVECPLARCFSTSDGNFASLEIGRGQQIVLKPGEVLKFSQTAGITDLNNANHNLPASPGFNFASGLGYPARDFAGNPVIFNSGATVRYELRANGFTAGATATTGKVPAGFAGHSRHFSLTHHEVYVGEDRADAGPSLGYGTMAIDWDFGNRRLKVGEDRGQTNPGTAGTKTTGRLFATSFTSPTSPIGPVFKPITYADGRPLTASALDGGKSPIAILSFNAKTEMGTNAEARTRILGRFNPKAHHVDFFDLSDKERDMLPYEYVVDPLVSWKNRSLESSGNGSGFFGGGMNAEYGNGAVITHSIPREPIVSLAALQHSFANGFEMMRPKFGYATLNSREPMLPQISHAIGNSVAPSMLAPGQVEGTLNGGRPVADHSYLANLNLWDDWFFSGIAPQNINTFTKQRAQKTVAEEFLNGTGKLPVTRYLADTSGTEIQRTMAALFSGANATDAGTKLTASMIRVDGLFNVNSTSIEAWKALLGSLKGRPVVTQTAAGAETVGGGNPADIPVPGLLTPQNMLANGGNINAKDEAQWVGRRTLSEKEIDQLARAVVKEVRKRGPFISLADFINRRPGSDKDLAKSGAIQSALDSRDVEINASFNQSDRAVASNVAGRFAFPEAELGPSAYGMPGIVKQADILTPIAPVLSARSDSFIVRAYGESVDGEGKVLARAWCEAVVERSKDFVDSADKPEIPIASLTSEANTNFGRRYKVAAFRWLHQDEV